MGLQTHFLREVVNGFARYENCSNLGNRRKDGKGSTSDGFCRFDFGKSGSNAYRNGSAFCRTVSARRRYTNVTA